MAKIAFYAPIKPPDHPIPSGDRLIAGNLIKALGLAGHEVELASRHIAYSKRSGLDILELRKDGALEDAANIIDEIRRRPVEDRPALWLTYHPYCKAPDWIGPRVAEALSIPYVTIEAARTRQGVDDEWGPWRKEAQAGIRMADRHLVFKPSDREYLIELLGSAKKLCAVPTFIDAEIIEPATPLPLPENWDRQTPVLVTTGMMRKGKKDKNFYLLAEILGSMQDTSWNLIVVGGGPEEVAIRDAFASIDATRIHWTGQVPHADVFGWMAAADIFVWPGWREPIGMVYLEAAMQDLPSIAFDSLGVSLVVDHGKTGLLAAEGDLIEFRQNIRQLLEDNELRHVLSAQSRQTVLDNHSLAAASQRIGACLVDLF